MNKEGISQESGWDGGGDFVHMVLMRHNETFVERIEDTKTTDEFFQIWVVLSYRVDKRLFDKNIEEFKAPNLEAQKKNDLYMNYNAIEDTIYNVREEAKKLTRDFYRK